ncbi:MAG: pyridoxamine 5'-phosphate oxidase family protein, partial [Gemmatimonadota bacterium]|nr:pyridoxamine 5'-phosphate oxidase family protein [Gemmatimonadota bacterium]
MQDRQDEDSSESDCSAAPSFIELDRQRCEELLRRHRVGRLAYTLHDRVQIVPIHFIYDDGWIYGRTSVGGKLNTLERNKSVAFEIDQSDGVFSWKSVVVHGAFYFIGRGAEADEQVFKHAVGLMRKLIPETLDEVDPVPFRNQLFRIHASEITGRAALSSGGEVREPSALPRSASIGQPEADTKLLDQVTAAVRVVMGDSASQLSIDASGGVVVLGGRLDDFTSRRAVEDAVKQVDGVLAIVQQIETDVRRGAKLTPG